MPIWVGLPQIKPNPASRMLCSLLHWFSILNTISYC